MIRHAIDSSRGWTLAIASGFDPRVRLLPSPFETNRRPELSRVEHYDLSATKEAAFDVFQRQPLNLGNQTPSTFAQCPITYILYSKDLEPGTLQAEHTAGLDCRWGSLPSNVLHLVTA
jgi:hypothetical protein